MAVEVASPFDASDAEWQKKLARYRKSGINEVARFDPDHATQPLRQWDRFDGDLVERSLDGDHALLWCLPRPSVDAQQLNALPSSRPSCDVASFGPRVHGGGVTQTSKLETFTALRS